MWCEILQIQRRTGADSHFWLNRPIVVDDMPAIS
jgi:hypothetical protein